jgi:hypothetical protein
MEEKIKSTMEEYQKLLSKSQLAIANLSKKKAVTTSVGKCVGVAAAVLTVAACVTAYVVHPTIGSLVAAGIGVAKAGAAGAGVAKAGAAAAGVAKAGAAAGVAKAGAAAGVAKAGIAAEVAKAVAAGAGLCISWAMHMQATIGHLERALSALKNINRTADNLKEDLNGTKSSLHDLETAIQLAGERLDDLSRPSKKPQGLRANLVSFLRCVLVCCPGLLADDPESLKQVREKGRIVVQNSNSVNEELKKLGLKINFLRQQVEDA